METDDLTVLAIKHGTDKWGPHFYTPIYDRFFSPLRDRPVKLLEIGVGGYEHANIGGSSLAMWAEYFPNGEITGIDIAPKTMDLGPRVTIRRGSQTDAAFLQALSRERGPFDIVIDDGSHLPRDVVASFVTLFPLMSNGFYVVEDVQTAFLKGLGGTPTGAETFNLAQGLMLAIQHAEIAIENPGVSGAEFGRTVRSFHSFHNLFMIEKGDNDEPSLFAMNTENPHFEAAFRQIEEQFRATPLPATAAILADMHGYVDREAAISFLAGARKTWPTDPRLREMETRFLRERVSV